MAQRHVIIELQHTRRLETTARAAMMGPDTAASLDAAAVPKLDGVTIDESFPPVALPKVSVDEPREANFFDTAPNLRVDLALETSTYIVRGTVEDSDLTAFEREAKRNKAVVGVYSDVAIEPMIVCPGSPAVGNDSTVESLLCAARLRAKGMDGTGVLVAIVDSGVNMAYLNTKGKHPNFDAARSWAWAPGLTPGSMPVDHGTMCAFDVCIAAPKCTILDIALLRGLSAPPGGTLISALLSDAIRAYRHLISVMSGPRRPGENASLVVNNSWGMFHPSWDFPVGHPGNYSDNPAHPFNVIVGTLAGMGADILFAAGNCGADCPDSRCRGVTTRTIYGANSHAQVISVAGVDTTKARAGYSAIGPGRLTAMKPDISGYTHFTGSGVYSADGGTSAACPVVSGVVAAVRTRRPYNPSDTSTFPAAIRNLLTSTATDLGTTGYDYLHGHGVVDGCALASRVVPDVDVPLPIDICRRYPWLCDPRWDICRRFPRICELIRERIRPPMPTPPPGPRAPATGVMDDASYITPAMIGRTEDEELSEVEAALLAGYLMAQQEVASQTPANKPHNSGGCGCKN